MADNIQVAIKVRPLINREKNENLTSVWTIQDNLIYPTDCPEQQYCFDHIFGADVLNSEIFNKIAKPIVESAVNGINGTLFAYGQTSSGKTYTMMGSQNEPGVINLSVFHIFERIENITGRQFLMRVSYLEIYNEKLRDLLTNDPQEIKIREDINGIFIRCREEVTNSPSQMLEIMHKGNKNRRVGETNMNERSSRSHTIFKIIIESRDLDQSSEDQTVQVSHLNLVDLAGSERANQTSATGMRLKEGCHINKSLLALSLVIKQLSEAPDSKTFINYRGSKLTRILQNSLGGNAMTGIICAVTPVALDETHTTLHFASAAKKIKNKPQVNEFLSETTLLKRMELQIIKLNKELEKEKSNVSSTDSINQLLRQRIRRLTENLVLSGSSISAKNVSAKSRRRTWCPGSKSDNETVSHFSTINTDIDEITPFEDFEIDLITDVQPDGRSLIPVSMHYQESKRPKRLSTLSDISECDSQISLESSFEQTQVVVASNASNKLKEVCCIDDETIKGEDYFLSKHFTPCELRHIITMREEELKKCEAINEFHNEENKTLMEEINHLRNKYEESQKSIDEKDTMITKLISENSAFKIEIKTTADEFKVLEISHNDIICQMEHIEKKFKSREQELLNLVEEAKVMNVKNYDFELKAIYDKFNKEKEELVFMSQMEKENLESLVKSQAIKISELEALADDIAKMKLELLSEQSEAKKLKDSSDNLLKNIKAEKDILINELKNITVKHEEAESKAEELKLKNSELEISLKNIYQINEELTNEIKMLKPKLKELALCNEQIDDLKLENAELETDIDKLKTVNIQLNNDVQAFREKTAMLEAESLCEYILKESKICVQLSTENKSYKVEVEKQNNLIFDLSKELNSLREQKNALEVNIKVIEEFTNKEILEHKALIEKLEKQVKDLEKDNNSLKFEINKLQDDIEFMLKNKEILEEEISQIRTTNDKLQCEHNSMLTEKLDAENALENAILGFSSKSIQELSIETEISDLQNQIDNMERLLNEKEILLQKCSSEKEELDKKLKSFDTKYILKEEYNALIEKNSKLIEDLKTLENEHKVTVQEIFDRNENLNKIQQEKLELLDRINALNEKFVDLEQNSFNVNDLKKSNAEVVFFKNKLYKEIKGFVQGDLAFIESLSLADLYDLVIKHVMEKQFELFQEQDHKYNQSKAWSQKLEQEIVSLNDEITKLTNTNCTLNKSLLTLDDDCKKLKLENENFKTQLEHVSSSIDFQHTIDDFKMQYDNLLEKHNFLENEFTNLQQSQDNLKIQYNDLLKQHDLLESEFKDEKLEAKKLLQQYDDLKSVFYENENKYLSLFNEYELFKHNVKEQELEKNIECSEKSEQSIDNKQFLKLSEELSIANEKLFNQKIEYEEKLNSLLLQQSTDDVKFEALMNEHKSCFNQNSEILKLSLQLECANEKLKQQDDEYNEKLKHCSILQKLNDEIKEQLDALIKEHSLCRNRNSKISSLTQELELANEISMQQKLENEENSANYLILQQSNHEIKIKYDALINEHNSCINQNTEILKLTQELEIAKGKLKQQEDEYNEKLNNYSILKESNNEMKMKLDFLIKEHNLCTNQNIEIGNLTQDLKIANQKLIRQEHEFDEKMKQYSLLQQSNHDMKMKLNTLINEHNLCMNQNTEIFKLTQELEITNAKLKQQEDEYNKKLKHYSTLQQLYDEIKMKLDALIKEHNTCMNQNTENIKLSEELRILNEKYSKLSSMKLQCEEQLHKFETMQHSFYDVKNKLDLLTTEHKSCNDKLNELSQKLQLANEHVVKQNIEREEKMRQYIQLQQSHDEIQNSIITLLNEHKSCQNLSTDLNKMKEREQSDIQMLQEKDALIKKLQIENNTLISKLTDLENSFDKSTILNLKSINSKLNKELKLLRATYTELKREYLKAKETNYDIEIYEKENKKMRSLNHDLSKNLECINNEKDILSRDLKEQIEKVDSFLKCQISKIQKLIDFEPSKPKIIPYIRKEKENYYEVFEEKFSILLKQIHESKTRLDGMEKLISECDRLKVENISLRLEQSNTVDIESKNKCLLKELDHLKFKLKTYADQQDKINKLSIELEDAINYATEAKKKINEQDVKIKSLINEILGIKEKYNCALKRYDALLEELNYSKVQVENLQEKVKILEFQKKDIQDTKARRYSMHDSSRNLPSPEPDNKMESLQCKIVHLESEIAKQKLEKRSIESDFKNQLQEIHENNNTLINKLAEKNKELNKLHLLIQENANQSSYNLKQNLHEKKIVQNEKSVQTICADNCQEDDNAPYFKEKYLRYRKLCVMRLREIEELKLQLGQNKENITDK